MRIRAALVLVMLAVGAARADTPLGITVSILGTEGGVLHLPADTSNPYYIDGFVADPAGDPLEGVAVSDGTQSTRTASDGTWSLAEPSAASRVVSMTSDRTDLALIGAAPPGIPWVYGSVVTLAYNIGVSSWSVDAVQATLVVVTSAPPPTAGSPTCVSAFSGSSSYPASYAGTAGGTSIWIVTVPSAIDRVGVRAFACQTLRALTDDRFVSYPLDRSATAPSGPLSWYASANPVIAFALSDSGSGVDPNSVQLIVAGRAVAVGRDRNHNAFQGQPRGLSDGIHAATIIASDRAGNTATLPIRIGIDTAAPAIGELHPSEGSVTDASPVIEVAAADAGSGIKPAAARFVLTNGVVASTLRPGLEDGVLRARIPEQGVGPNLGDGPLPPGFYTVDAYVQDVAGNESHLSAFFAVLP